MTVTIKPGKADGTVAAPPSKSMAHRLLICAGMSEGESVIGGISPCDDVDATLGCLRLLGAKAEKLEDGRMKITGCDMSKSAPKEALYCFESGSTLRFLLPIALLSGHKITLRGADSLMRRPMEIYENFCRENKLFYEKGSDYITVKGKLTSGKYTVVGNVSSQFISGLLFALPRTSRDSEINIIPPIESRSYIDLTISALNKFGIHAGWKNDHTIEIRGSQKYIPCETEVEGDYSNAAFLDALNLLGGNVTISGLSGDSIQGDSVYKRYFEMLAKGTPALHIGDCPDLGPIMFALAAAKHGGVFSGTRRLKIKESDRCDAMARELRKLGASVSIGEDTVSIFPAEFRASSEALEGHNDHRIVMSLAVILTVLGGKINGAEAVAKSFPDFFDRLSELGIEVEYDKI